MRRYLSSSSSINKQQNAFAILGLEPSMNIDASQLKAAYLRLMNTAHPDRHTSKSPEDRQALEQQASAVTAAYQRLKTAHTRAAHLLELHGHAMEETRSGTNVVGGDFLMEIMELRESIQNMADDETLRAAMQENQKRLQVTCEDLAAAINAQDFEQARELTARLQYWNRVEETIREKMDSVD